MSNPKQDFQEKQDHLKDFSRNKASISQEYQEILDNMEEIEKNLDVMYTALQITKYELTKMSAQNVKIETYLASHENILKEKQEELKKSKPDELNKVISYMDTAESANVNSD